MAITWGSWRAGGGNNYRVGVDLTYSPASLTPATTEVTVTARLYLQSEWASNGGSDSWWLTSSGGISASNVGGWSWTTSAMQQLLVHSATDVVPLSLTNTQSYSATGRLKDLGASSLDISVTKSITIPRRPINPPADPSGLVASRVSDNQQTVNWTNHSTSSAPYTTVEVRRDVFHNGAWSGWSTVASLSGSANSYVDNATAAPRAYRYAVRALNAAGSSAWHYGNIELGTNYVATTPTTPTAPTATKNASNDIVVTRPALVATATRWQVQESTDDGVSWSTVALDVPASQATWTHTAPSGAVPHRYRIRCQAGFQGGGVWSEYSASSATVQVLAPPLAPTNLAPPAADATGPVVLTWAHNPVDTTPQVGYQIRHRPVGTSLWTTLAAVPSMVSQHTMSGWVNGTEREWQVRTRGQHATYGEWSATQTTVLNARPVVGIESPAAVHNSDRLTATWTFYDPEGGSQARWEARLKDSTGTVVETRSGFGSRLYVTFFKPLPDGTNWTLEVTAWDGTGLPSATASQAFTVDWAEPPTPTGTAVWHPDEGYVTLTVDAPEPTGAEVPVDHIEVWRAVGSEWALVATGLQPGQSLVDMIPPTGGAASYRVSAVSGLPSTSLSEVISVGTQTKWVFINFGPGFGRVVKLWGNLSASRSAGREKTLHRFANRPLPTERSGVARTRTYTLSARLFAPFLSPDASSTWADILELADAPAPVLVRDPQGVRLFCSVGEPSESDHLQPHPTVSIPFTQVDWSEVATPEEDEDGGGSGFVPGGPGEPWGTRE